MELRRVSNVRATLARSGKGKSRDMTEVPAGAPAGLFDGLGGPCKQRSVRTLVRILSPHQLFEQSNTSTVPLGQPPCLPVYDPHLPISVCLSVLLLAYFTIRRQPAGLDTTSPNAWLGL